MQAFLNTAVKAARRAGEIAVRAQKRLDELEVREKSRNEFVTQVDQAAEQAIIATIRERYPDHAVVAEESGASGQNEFTWIIDPLDGTTNYVHGFPVFAVSIALRRRDQLEVGVVYDPTRQELFTAIRGSGVQVDGRRVRVSGRRELDGSLLATGFPYRSNIRYLTPYLGMLRAVMERTAGVRRPGSAALDLAYVAAGRTDGFFEFGLAAWDIAAGMLMVQEGGGLVSGLTPEPVIDSGNILAGSPKIHDALRELLLPHLNSAT
jgi:myo-inositol-1(or 4)-monophosphatase